MALRVAIFGLFLNSKQKKRDFCFMTLIPKANFLIYIVLLFLFEVFKY